MCIAFMTTSTISQRIDTSVDRSGKRSLCGAFQSQIYPLSLMQGWSLVSTSWVYFRQSFESSIASFKCLIVDLHHASETLMTQDEALISSIIYVSM